MILQHARNLAGGAPLPSKGEEIRRRIAENRAKRLAIAEAMKDEAGVTGHEINWEDFGGLAFIGTGRIRSPEGRTIVQLYTVAHECGHIFLHNEAPGYHLPAHVKELEAESYAHQAFREHGMQLPRRLSDWGRSYVGSWIEKDRAAGFAIDPRAIAYANGSRSPYEPLRMVPETWALHAAIESGDAVRSSMGEMIFRDIPRERPNVSGLLPYLATICRNVLAQWWRREDGSSAEVRLVMLDLYRGVLIGWLLLTLLATVYLPSDVEFSKPTDFSIFKITTVFVLGIWWSGVAMLWRTFCR